MRLCPELFAKTFILVLLVPFWREREAAAPREQRLNALVGLQSLQQLRQNASHRPNIDLRVVVVLQQNEFWRAVPAGHHMLSQLPIDCRLRIAPGGGARNVALPMRTNRGHDSTLALVSILTVHLTRKTKVDDFQFTLVVYKDIRWFQITMHNIATLHSSEKYCQHLLAYTISHTAIGMW